MVNRQAKRLVGQKSFRLKVFVNIQTHAHIELTALYAPLPLKIFITPERISGSEKKNKRKIIT